MRSRKEIHVQVRSLAKKTLGSTRTGRAMRLPAVRWSRGWVDMAAARAVVVVVVVDGVWPGSGSRLGRPPHVDRLAGWTGRPDHTAQRPPVGAPAVRGQCN